MSLYKGNPLKKVLFILLGLTLAIVLCTSNGYALIGDPVTNNIGTVALSNTLSVFTGYTITTNYTRVRIYNMTENVGSCTAGGVPQCRIYDGTNTYTINSNGGVCDFSNLSIFIPITTSSATITAGCSAGTYTRYYATVGVYYSRNFSYMRLNSTSTGATNIWEGAISSISTGPELISWANPTPIDQAVTLNNETLNFTCTFPSTLMLWFDSNINPITLVKTQTGTSYLNYTTNLATKGVYYYKASCDNSARNSSVRLLIYGSGLDNCSTYTTRALNISFINADTMTTQTVNYSALVNYTFGSTTYNYFGSNLNIYNTSFCIIPNYVNLSATLQLTYIGANQYVYSYSDYLNNQTKALTLYLQNTASQTTITVKDLYSQRAVTNALVTSYRFINNNWIPLEQRYTDPTGAASFNYVPNIQYKFLISASGYSDYGFTPNLPLASSYTIPITRINGLNSSTDYERVVVYFNPDKFYDGYQQFTWAISSPFNELDSYSYTITYPSGIDTESGTNPGGQILYSNLNINSTQSNYKVQLDFFYVVNNIKKNYTFIYYIANGGNFIANYSGTSLTNNTMKNPTCNIYGLALFDRLLIVTFFIVLFAGIATLMGKPLIGMFLAAALWFFFVYICFIPVWAVLLPALILLIILSKRSESGY